MTIDLFIYLLPETVGANMVLHLYEYADLLIIRTSSLHFLLCIRQLSLHSFHSFLFLHPATL